MTDSDVHLYGGLLWCSVGGYHNNMLCTWRAVSASPSRRVVAVVSSFSTETLFAEACVLDSVEIVDSVTTSNASVVVTTCGVVATTSYASSGSGLDLVLQSDRANRSSGFNVQFFTVPVCAQPNSTSARGIGGMQ